MDSQPDAPARQSAIVDEERFQWMHDEDAMATGVLARIVAGLGRQARRYNLLQSA